MLAWRRARRGTPTSRPTGAPGAGGAGGGEGAGKPAPGAEPVAEVRPELPRQQHGSKLDRAAARTATWSLRLLLIALALVVVGYVIGKFWVIVLPVVLGLLLSSVLWPIARMMRRWLPDWLASLIVVVGALAALGGLITVLVPLVTDQTDELVDAVVRGLDDLRELVAGPPFNLGEDQVGQLVDQGVNQLQQNAQTIGGGVLSGVTALGNVVINTLLALVLSFFFLKDGPKFIPWVSGWVGPQAAPHVVEVSRRSWFALSGFIKAQAAVGLVDAVGIGIGLLVLGVPLAVPLAVLVFFGAFIPIVGAIVTGALAAIVALVTNGFTTALIVVALVLVVQQVESNVLQPLLVGKALELHAAIVILAVTAGGSLAGIVGAFLAVPVAAVVTVVLRYARTQFLPGPEPEPGGAAEPA